MPIISLISSKGGCGKTTVAVLLATELARYGSVCLIDTDPRQRTTKWHSRKPIENPAIQICLEARDFTKVLKSANQDYAFVVVDTEGRESNINSVTIGRSDLVIIPTRDRQQDCEDTLDVISEIQGIADSYDKTLQYRVLFNAVKPVARTKLQVTLRSMVSDENPTFNTAITDRGPYDAIFNQGGGLKDLDTKEFSNTHEATEEIFRLVEEILNVLGEKQ
jgi:chromosome partitioning protein